MAISVLLLIISAIVLIFLVPHSRYGLPMFFIIFGVVLATLSVLFQYYSSSSYVPPLYLPFRNFDIYLYRTIGRNIKLPMGIIQTLRNLGVVIYLLGISALIDIIRTNIKQGKRKKSFFETNVSRVICICLSFLYLFFYSNKTAYKAYLLYYKIAPSSRKHLVFALSALHVTFCVAIAIFMFYPLVLFLINVIKKNVTCFINTVIILVSSVTVTNVCFYYFLFLGIFKNTTKDVFKNGFWFFNKINKIPNLYLSIYPLFALAMLVFIVLSINGFFDLDLVSYSQNRILKKQIDDLNYNLKDFFHSEKNLMFSVNILANEALSDYGSKEGEEKLKRIIDISNRQMTTLSESLNSIKLLSNIKKNAVDIKKLTDEAISSVSIPEDVVLIKNYCPFDVLCTLDPYHTKHALSNLIMNSLDSLAMSESNEKKIEITIDASKEWVYWALYDNGTGLDKRSVKKFMMPFVSTKSKNTNWGIGLPYAFRVISTQLGQMKITGSKTPGKKYALVEILLPRRRNDNGKDQNPDS